jgi:hypothetical protein
MANTSSAANAVCPYYQRESGKSLTCEGLIDGTVCTMRFDSAEARLEWQAMSCEMHNYQRCCPLAAALEKKYEEEQENDD